MELTRRRFMQIGAAAGATVAVSGLFSETEAMEVELGGKGVAVDKGAGIGSKGSGFDKVVPYTCLVCNIEDGGLAYIKDGRVKKLEGNDKHVSTRGRLCAKGNAGIGHVYDPDRILYPLKRTGPRGSGQYKRISWDEAISEVAANLKKVIDSGHPNEIMVHWGRDRSGGAYGRFMKTLGTSTGINHTSTCESSKKIGMEHTWGPDIETPDFANTKYILNFGSNILEAAYFHNPYAQRVVEGRAEGHAKLVTVDCRLSNTAGRSDEWLSVFPGTDAVVALAMANVIMSEGLADTEFINNWTNYPADKLAAHLKQYTPEMAEKYSGVPAADIRRIAIEFASVKPATVYTYRGPSKHLYGSYAERCVMLLPIITGNVEKKGGYNLPRGMGYGQPGDGPKGGSEPSFLSSHPDYPLAGHKVSHLVPFWIKEGKQKVSVYINYMTAPAYTYPAASVWREVLSDENLFKFNVTFSNQMNENTALMDIILPDGSYLERWDPESMPSSAWPWVGIRQPVIKPLGEAIEVRGVFQKIIHKIDPDGSKGMKKSWNFKDGEDYVKQQFAGVKGLDWDKFKKDGVFPIYGKLDPATGKIAGKDGKPITAQFGDPYKETSDGKANVGGKKYAGFGTGDGKINIYAEGYKKYGFNPLPVFKANPLHWNMDGSSKLSGDQMILTTFKWNVHVQSRTPNVKWLTEMVHSNPAWLNAGTAAKLGVKNGDLIRITSGVGYIVTKVRVTEGIHPMVIAVSNTFGTKFGRFATANKMGGEGQFGAGDDPDLKNIWWKSEGVNPNYIIPAMADPIGGSASWYDTVVTVTRAQSGDNLGDTKADSAKHFDLYKEGMRYAYTGDKHLEMHPESKGMSLPKPEMGKGH
ncbi:MAG: molybdopterin-dependent oxidoreductase [Deltaproteobacteria bacterium]|nr:molybdopterin-dependent oxidoreductase [Deltaproteobacteria bacterium]MBI5893194.1 molybdopterin-dependent oxidoreductase [Deltaproteobacteria bacterium]